MRVGHSPELLYSYAARVCFSNDTCY